MTTRSPQEVFAHHAEALGAEDLESIVSDYSEDALLIVNREIYRGLDGVRRVFTGLLGDVPQATWKVNTVYADDVLYLEWQASGGGRKIEDGIDTFVFRDGVIDIQTVVYTVQPA